jgi:hypothetical protein
MAERASIRAIKVYLRQIREYLAVCIDFSNDGEARAFKNRFSPPEVTSSSSILVNGSSIPLARPEPETLARISWWRLMAEEVRTDADEMSCASAKEMMGSVGATYDRLTENLDGGSPIAATGTTLSSVN